MAGQYKIEQVLHVNVAFLSKMSNISKSEMTSLLNSGINLKYTASFRQIGEKDVFFITVFRICENKAEISR